MPTQIAMERNALPSSFRKDMKHVQFPSSIIVWALLLLKFPRVDGTVDPYGGECTLFKTGLWNPGFQAGACQRGQIYA